MPHMLKSVLVFPCQVNACLWYDRHLSLQEVKENFNRNRQMETHKAGRKNLYNDGRSGGRWSHRYPMVKNSALLN